MFKTANPAEKLLIQIITIFQCNRILLTDILKLTKKYLEFFWDPLM